MTYVRRSGLVTRATYQRTTLGIVVTLAGLGALLALLLPFRSHLSIAIPALAFVLPAMAGVVIGGFVPGVVGALAGFLVYDYFFLPPYNTLTVRSPSNWFALAVYVVVVLVVAQVVASQRHAREEALRRTEESERLFELSQALIGDLTLSQLLTHIVSTVQSVFVPRWTALVLPDGGRDATGSAEVLRVAATAGQTLTDADVASLTSGGGQARSLGLVDDTGPRRVSVALVVSHRPVGMLVLQDVQLAERERNLLGTFANQAALTVDRAQLREQALRTRLLEEIDRWRRALMGAASHDLRTPLASIKTAVSSLRQVDAHSRTRRPGRAPGAHRAAGGPPGPAGDQPARHDPHRGRSARAAADDRRLRRIGHRGGGFAGRPGGARPYQGRRTGRPAAPASRSRAHEPGPGERAGERGTAVPRRQQHPRGGADRTGSAATRVEIAVSDDGPGIDREERERVFEMFSQNGGGGRAGLGLAIAKAFVEAHGGLIWIDPDVARGARVVFTVPCETRVTAPRLSLP